MCGITGVYHFAKDDPVPPEWLDRMCKVMAYRGPDGQGTFVDRAFGMGMRRLSIIDVEGGGQPIFNEDGTVAVVFNGEIYNYVELRRRLEPRHLFKTLSDTEVIVHLYEEVGERLFESLRGMFAIALWDSRRRILLLARDRVGKKPLFYTVRPGYGIAFGSELKCLLEIPWVEQTINLGAIDDYLSFLYVPTPTTIFQEVNKLPPAHYAVITADGISLHRYWDLRFEPRHGRKEYRWTEDLYDELTEAVRIRLRSDVPLGAFLSGGIDSSSIVALMAEGLERPVCTSSVGFVDQTYDERPYARQVARMFGCNHLEYLVEADISRLLEKVVYHFDEPFADSSAIPTYYVSETARRFVTVALSGDGGDEVFCGYSRHLFELWEGRVRRMTPWIPSRVFGTVANWMGESFPGRNSLKNLSLTASEACARKHKHTLFGTESKQSLLSREMQASLAGRSPYAGFIQHYERCTADDPVDRALYVEMNTYLPDDILVKVDRMSMANSLEVRCPFLDHRVLEFMATVPSDLKIRWGRRKYLLRKTMTGRIPASILNRRKKGFSAPIGRWLRGELAEMTESLLLDGTAKARGYFDPKIVETLWREHRTGGRNYQHRLWILLMLELWHRRFVDRKGM